MFMAPVLRIALMASPFAPEPVAYEAVSTLGWPIMGSTAARRFIQRHKILPPTTI